MLALATSEEEVRERLKADVYFREGVWDWDRVVVYPVSWFQRFINVVGRILGDFI